MVVGVNVPAAYGAGKALHCGFVAFPIGVKVVRKHCQRIQGIGGAYRLSHPGNTTSVGADQTPPGGGFGNQLITGENTKITIREEPVHGPGPGFHSKRGVPQGTFQQLDPPSGEDPAYACLLRVEKPIAALLGVDSCGLLKEPQCAFVIQTTVYTYVCIGYSAGMHIVRNRYHFLAYG